MHETGYDFCECDVKGCEMKLCAASSEINSYGWVIDQKVPTTSGGELSVCLCPEHAIRYRQISDAYVKAMDKLLAEGK